MTGDLSIGTLAERTGLTPNVLRTWEHRFGFPAGQRTASGHRRFTDADAVLVTEVLRARESGVPLQVAIDAVRQRHRTDHEDSVHAVLVREFPDLRPHRLGKRTLLAASHAIEDECLARADRAVVLGTFQEGHRFERSRPRWEELARTALWSAVVADFDEALPPDPQASPARVQLVADSPLRREWTVVVLGDTFSAVLSAWEVPSPGGRPSHYEAVISTRRAVAQAAARVIAGHARTAGATPPAEVERLLAQVALPPDVAAGDADRMWIRALALLD